MGLEGLLGVVRGYAFVPQHGERKRPASADGAAADGAKRPCLTRICATCGEERPGQ